MGEWGIREGEYGDRRDVPQLSSKENQVTFRLAGRAARPFAFCAKAGDVQSSQTKAKPELDRSPGPKIPQCVYYMINFTASNSFVIYILISNPLGLNILR